MTDLLIKPLDEAAHQWGFLLVVSANFLKMLFYGKPIQSSHNADFLSDI